MSYVPLHMHSQFSFLDGASNWRELVDKAVNLDIPSLAATDHDNVAIAVEHFHYAQKQGITPIQGAEITIKGTDRTGNYHLTVLAQNPAGYSQLCKLLTRSHCDNPRGQPCCDQSMLEQHSSDLIVLSGCRKGEIPSLILAGRIEQAQQVADYYRSLFADRLFLELPTDMLPGNNRLIAGLMYVAEKLQLDCVATGNVHYAERDEFCIHDTLTCIRTQTTLADVHPQRRLNADNYLKSRSEMVTALIHSGLTTKQAGRALDMTIEVANRCSSVFIADRCLYPEFLVDDAPHMLRQLTYQGAEARYGNISSKLNERLEHELAIITKLGYADYFLLVWDVGRFARSKGIRFAGRGSAADSVVAYCLGLTEVDAFARDLLFERFLSEERAQTPDIDLDIASDRRDEVSEYVTNKYGADKVASVCTYSTFQARSAIRAAGKVLQLPQHDIDRIAKRLPYMSADKISQARERFPELRCQRELLYDQLVTIAEKIANLPRHIATHIGGLVICRLPITDISPIQIAATGKQICQFDRDYVENLGLLKLDLLSLRTLTAVDETIDLAYDRGVAVDYDRIEADEDTMKMINRGETLGVFQLESPAQRALQSRLKASEAEDIIASIALIRPGPIKGNMVEPFINRRQGKEKITYLHPLLEPILKDTYGVVLYQEQVIEIAIAIAGFTPGEADRLRRVMSHGRSHAEMEQIGKLFITRAQAEGVDEATARQIFTMMQGYASYGFCEAHAAAFGTTALKTAYLVRHRPAEFFASLLSCQPMGYYPPRTLCVEAQRRGVGILMCDVNKSEERYTVEDVRGTEAIRVGLMQVIGNRARDKLLSARKEREFWSVADVKLRSGLDKDDLAAVVEAGCCDSVTPNRRQALWQVNGASDVACDDFTVAERSFLEQKAMGFSITAHPMSLIRSLLKGCGYVSSKQVIDKQQGQWVKTAGIPVRPHRPPTRSGKTTVFLSLEDEFGLCEVTVFERVYQRHGAVLFDGTPVVAVEGRVQWRGESQVVIAHRVRSVDEVAGKERQMEK